jgi:hypothetical protein
MRDPQALGQQKLQLVTEPRAPMAECENAPNYDPLPKNRQANDFLYAKQPLNGGTIGADRDPRWE